jgi:hypothetical protein
LKDVRDVSIIALQPTVSTVGVGNGKFLHERYSHNFQNALFIVVTGLQETPTVKTVDCAGILYLIFEGRRGCFYYSTPAHG